jgi:hypothetical protein
MFPVCGIPSDRGQTLACIALPRSDYEGTNFEAAAISVNIIKSAGKSCPTSGEAEHSEVINGLTFAVSLGGGVAAGNILSRSQYRIVHSNRCYEIDMSVGYANISVYPAGTVKEFDLNATKALLQEVLKTFRFVK